jgi:hypothetical protein
MHIIYFYTSINSINSIYSVNSLLSITSIVKYSVMFCTSSAIICNLRTDVYRIFYVSRGKTHELKNMILFRPLGRMENCLFSHKKIPYSFPTSQVLNKLLEKYLYYTRHDCLYLVLL